MRVPFALAVAAGCLVSCACGEETYRSVLIREVPHVRQKPDFCGEACAEMYLRKLGSRLDQDAVFDASGLDPVLGRGCYTRDLLTALTSIGFEVGRGWQSVQAARGGEQMEEQFAALHADLLRGVPSIICMHYDDAPRDSEHFRLILGYDATKDEVLYHEPAVDDGAYQRMSREKLLRLWPLKYRPEQWTVIRLKLSPGRLQQADQTERFSDADFAQHVRDLKRRLPSEGFHIVIRKPFVVVGDETPEVVRQRADRTVAWAVRNLKQVYFEEDPLHILDVWLFKDKESYEKHNEQLFGSTPSTPYGYYSRVHKALVMNIQTGGGTLVHEIVHPFMEANFPACPAWFNEGLASLYEQCGEREGRIAGFTNWRLRGLQQSIQAQRVPSFEKLCGTTTREFYNEDPGTNYAQARYLCYYLQEEGKLVEFYEKFRENAERDPGGYGTLKAVLGEADMERFQENWQAYILKLRFR